MAKQTLNSAARVHRFRDLVAVSVGDGSTAYLTPKAARQLAKALGSCAHSVRTVPFGQSSFGSREIHDGDDWQESGRDYREPRP